LESEHHEGEGEQAAARLAEVFAIMAAEVLAHLFPLLLLLRGGTERKEMVKRRKTPKWDPLSGEERISRAVNAVNCWRYGHKKW
jgi:hypothetical protein